MPSRPCDHGDRRPRPSDCRVCWLFINDARYYYLWSDDVWSTRVEGFVDKPRVALGTPKRH
jgi:hypothetical protein